MKTVFQNHSQVCSVWVQNKQEYGRSGNIDFRGNTIYSYRHYAIGRLYPEKKIALFQQDTYSVSTAGHISLAEYAARNYTYKTMRVWNVNANHEENINWLLGELKRTVDEFNNSKERGRWKLRSNQSIYDKLVRYCKAFDVKMPITLGLYLDPEYPFVKNRFYELNGRELFLPKWIAKKGFENLEIKDLLKIRNAEIRRELISRFGIERVCYELKAKTIDKQGNYELLLLDLRDGRNRPFLKMINPSCENVWHIEGVHPAIKTVQDALNYRRYGNDMFVSADELDLSWEERRRYEFEIENWQIKPEFQTTPLFKSEYDWKPEKLT